MNKKLLILPVTLLASGVVSCNNATESTTKLSELDRFYNAFRKFDEGFVLKGVILQTRQQYGLNPQTGSLFPVGDSESQAYNIDFTFQSKEQNAIKKSTVNLAEVEAFTFFEDEEGYAYSETLNKQNEVERVYQKNNGDKIPFVTSGFSNPFEMFNKSDFTYNSDFKRFDLNRAKTSIMVNDLFYSVNTGFYGYPVKSSMKFYDDQILQFDVRMEDRMIFESVSDSQVVPFMYQNEATFTFEDIGTAKVPHVESYKDEANPSLTNAFNEIGNNFDMIYEETISINKGTPSKDYKKFSFDGKNVYVHAYSEEKDENSKDLANDFILKPIDESNALYSYVYSDYEKAFVKGTSKNFAKLYQGSYYYKDLIPNFKDVSTCFFKYQKETNEFVNDDEMVIKAVVDSFYPNSPAFHSEGIDNTYQIGIRLTNDNKIDYVKFYFHYKDAFSSDQNEIEGNVKLKFKNVGGVQI